jgi:hypothetical protein
MNELIDEVVNKLTSNEKIDNARLKIEIANEAMMSGAIDTGNFAQSFKLEVFTALNKRVKEKTKRTEYKTRFQDIIDNKIKYHHD